MDKEEFFRRYESDSAFRELFEGRAAQQLSEALLTAVVAGGHVSVKGKSAKEISEEFRNYLSIERIRSARLLIAVDYTGTLRVLGREFVQNRKWWLAIVMYATWVEHTLNYLIDIGAHRRGFSHAAAKQIIRDVPLPAKLSWLLPLLGFRHLHPTHRNTLQTLANKRNEFVHYKWPHRESHDDAEIKALLPPTEKAITYLAQYCSRQTLGGRKSEILKLARLRAISNKRATGVH